MRQATGLWLGFCGALISAWPLPVQALSVGDMRARSVLGEPLRLELTLTDLGAVPVSEIDVSLAWAEDHQRLGIPYPDWGEQLRFYLVQAPGGRAQLFMTSPEPMTSSGVTLLLRMVWPGHLVLQQVYATIPDPVRPQPAQAVTLPAPAAPAAAAAPVAAPEPVHEAPAAVVPPAATYLPDPAWVPYQPAPASASAPARAPAVAVVPVPQPAPEPRDPPRQEAAPRTPAPPPAPVAAPVVRSLPADGFQQLQVQPGDTLSRLARNWRVPGLSPAQRQQLIARSNPHAFIGGDINRLRANVTLTLPDLGKLPQTPEEAAQLSHPAEVAPPATPVPAPGRPEVRLTLVAPEGSGHGGRDGQGAGGVSGAGEGAVLAASEAHRQTLLATRGRLQQRLNLLSARTADQDRRLKLLDARLASFRQMPGEPAPALQHQERARQQVLLWFTAALLLAALLAFFLFRRSSRGQDSLLDRG